MNAKSRLKVKYAKCIIEVNATFAREMQNPMSDEYALLQKVKTENTNFGVRIRKIKSNPRKDSYKGLTYGWMRNYIATHEAECVVEQKLAYFDEMVCISKCHSNSLRYPTIKKWFLAEYPNVAKFGTLTTASNEPEEPEENEFESQNPAQIDTTLEGLGYVA